MWLCQPTIAALLTIYCGSANRPPLAVQNESIFFPLFLAQAYRPGFLGTPEDPARPIGITVQTLLKREIEN